MIGPSRKFLPDVDLPGGVTLFYPVDSCLEDVNKMLGFDVIEASKNSKMRDFLYKSSTSKCPVAFGSKGKTPNFYNGLRDLMPSTDYREGLISGQWKIMEDTGPQGDRTKNRFIGICGIFMSNDAIAKAKQLFASL